MALPLPASRSLTGDLYDIQNAITKDSLAKRRQEIENQYLPYTSYAQAQSQLAYANYLPWQIKSQILSNPYLALSLKDHPEMLNKMLEEFGKNMPSTNTLSNGMNMPLPSSINNNPKGLLGFLAQKLMGGQNNNAMNQMPPFNNSSSPESQTSPGVNIQGPSGASPSSSPTNFPLVPSTQGGAGGVIGKQTAPFTQSPYIKNPTIPNPNNPNEVISAPNEETVTSSQKAVLAAKRVEPILNNIIRDFQDIYNIPGALKLISSVGGNLSGASPETLEKLGVPKGQYSKFLKAQNNVDKAIIDVMKVYDIHQEAGMNEIIKNILSFHPGEDKEGYLDRVKSEINDLKTQQNVNEQAMTGGYSVSALGNQPEAKKEGIANVQNPQLNAPSQEDLEYTAKLYHMSVDEVKKQLGIK